MAEKDLWIGSPEKALEKPAESGKEDRHTSTPKSCTLNNSPVIGNTQDPGIQEAGLQLEVKLGFAEGSLQGLCT